MADARVLALLAEFDIEVIPAHRYPMPGQTRALATVGRIIGRHGEGHARLVLCILGECRGNNALIDETSLTAVSSLVLACGEMVERDASGFLELFDTAPIGPMMVMASELRGVIHQANALAGMLYAYARNKDILRARKASGSKVEAAAASEVEKGRPVLTASEKRLQERLELGKHLLEVKARLPHGAFGPWLKQQSFTTSIAHDCMRLAKTGLTRRSTPAETRAAA